MLEKEKKEMLEDLEDALLAEEEELEDAEELDEKDEILDNMNVIENVLEFIKNSDTMCVTFSQRRFITKVKRLAEKFPDEVTILAENSDGSICAKMPVRALHLSLVKKRELTEEQRQEAAERLAKYKKTKSN